MSVLNTRLILGVSAIIVLLLLVSLAQEMNRRLQIQHEVQQLEADVQDMRQKVIELENLNQYFRTDDYRERLAREKLNYQAPGEKVVLVPSTTNQQPDDQPSSPETTSIPIPERWWRIFFAPTPS